MKHYLSLAAIAALLASPAICADTNSRVPPPRPLSQLDLPPDFVPPPIEPLPDAEPPIECDLRASPDYVPGIDVNGREVAPADVPTGRQVEIDTQVYVEARPRSRQLPGAGVIVNLPDLGAPACVPFEEKLPK